MELDQATFMRRKLGRHWRDALIIASAIAPADSSMDEVDDAERRAIDLVSDVNEDWTLELRDLTAEAWQVLRRE